VTAAAIHADITGRRRVPGSTAAAELAAFIAALERLT
jgi:hypothetical protein